MYVSKHISKDNISGHSSISRSYLDHFFTPTTSPLRSSVIIWTTFPYPHCDLKTLLLRIPPPHVSSCDNFLYPSSPLLSSVVIWLTSHSHDNIFWQSAYLKWYQGGFGFSLLSDNSVPKLCSEGKILNKVTRNHLTGDMLSMASGTSRF